MLTITIDGNEYSADGNKTILEICRENTISIPTLCEDESLKPFGGCRLCVVEVQGRKNLMASCSVKAEEGMVINTNSEKVTNARKTVLDLLVSNHPMDCLTCSKVGQCDLQEYAFQYGVNLSFEGEKKNYPRESLNPVMMRDQSKCILCGKCVRVCEEVQVTHAIDFCGRGFHSKITAGFDLPLDDKNCRLCGQCISVCPTAAIMDKNFIGVRPWDVKKVKTTCPFCGVGCNFDLNVVNGKVVGVTPNETSIVNGKSLCVKGRSHTDFLYSEDRITTPLIKINGKFEEASWEEAIQKISENFLKIKKESGSDAFAGLSSARACNEDNYVFQKFFRAVLGTHNIDHCARTCHAPTVAGLAATLGSGAMTNSINEIYDNEMMLVVGCNATEAHPIIGNKMKVAKKHKGAKLVVVDPRKTELARMADIWLPLKNGTDVALFNGIMHIIIKEGWEDQEFVQSRSEGFEELKKLVEGYTPERVADITGISPTLQYEVAKMYTSYEKAGIFYTLGITEHSSGTENVMTSSNLAVLTGHLGKEASGINPLRGQNNVQGSCDMGALPNTYPGYGSVADETWAKFYSELWNTELSTNIGYKIPEMMDACVEGEIRSMYIMGEDPILTDPNANHIKKALNNLDFLVVQDLFLTPTAELADVFLPAACYAEKDGTFTNTERRVQRVRNACDAPGEARVDWEIIAQIAREMGIKEQFHWGNSSEVFDEIALATPSYRGMSYERIDKEGLQWPCPTKEHPGTKFVHKGIFARGKALFMPAEYREPGELPCEDYPYLLNTGRMLYHYNITTRHSETLSSIRPGELMEIHPKDAKLLGLKQYDCVKVTSRRGSVRSRITITDKVQPGQTFMTIHHATTPTNELTTESVDNITMTGEYKICAVQIEKIEDQKDLPIPQYRNILHSVKFAPENKRDNIRENIF